MVPCGHIVPEIEVQPGSPTWGIANLSYDPPILRSRL